MTKEERFTIKWELSRDYRKGYMDALIFILCKINEYMSKCSDHGIYIGFMIVRDIIEKEMEDKSK